MHIYIYILEDVLRLAMLGGNIPYQTADEIPYQTTDKGGISVKIYSGVLLALGDTLLVSHFHSQKRRKIRTPMTKTEQK